MTAVPFVPQCHVVSYSKYYQESSLQWAFLQWGGGGGDHNGNSDYINSDDTACVIFFDILVLL